MRVDDLLARLERVQHHGSYWTARCPAHEDHNPSLSISIGDNDGILLNCHAGCTTAAICEAIGIELADLFADREQAMEIEAVYPYEDENGTRLYEVVRFTGKQFRQRLPDGTWGLGDTRRVLYRLPQVHAAVANGDIIYIVEGEKDVHAAEKAGAVATCNPMGAGKWRDEYADQLRGANCVIVADRDDPGRAHARTVALSTKAPVVEPIHGKDLTDHLHAGHTFEDLKPLDIDEQAVIFETLGKFLTRKLAPARALVGVVRGGTNLLPQFGWVLPWGREGSGKTSVIIDLIFHAACGLEWLGWQVDEPVRFVLIVNEGVPGGFQDKLAAKVETWEGDLDAIRENIAVYSSPWGEFSFRNQEIVDHARTYARDIHKADYVALDPLHTLGPTGAGAPTDTEEFKHVLRDFGLWKDFGVMTAHHSNKAGMVSGDWGRHADTVIHLEKDGKNPRTKLTLEKARPADPAELHVPCLLDWQVETLSYKRRAITAGEGLDTALALDAILMVLRDAPHQNLGGLTTAARKTMKAADPDFEASDGAFKAVIVTAIDRGQITNLKPPKKTPDGRQSYDLIASKQGNVANGAEDLPLSAVSRVEYEQTSMVEPNTNGAEPLPLPADNWNGPEAEELTANGGLYVVEPPSPAVSNRGELEDLF